MTDTSQKTAVQLRKEAAEKGDIYFTRAPCKNCDGTLFYTFAGGGAGQCVQCRRERSASEQTKSAERVRRKEMREDAAKYRDLKNKHMVALDDVIARLEQGFGKGCAPVTTLLHHFGV